jgi:maleate isomerase
MALATKRIGLLVPSSNSTVEVEFYRALPREISLHVARLPITQVDPESIAGMVDPLETESRKLASADVDVIVLGAAAPSFLRGMGYDREMSARIAQASGKPATTASTALLQSAAALGAKRIALGTAYSSKVNEIAIAFLQANGIEVVKTECLGYVDNLEIGRLDVQTAYDLGRRIACAEGRRSPSCAPTGNPWRSSSAWSAIPRCRSFPAPSSAFGRRSRRSATKGASRATAGCCGRCRRCRPPDRTRPPPGPAPPCRSKPGSS